MGMGRKSIVAVSANGVGGGEKTQKGDSSRFLSPLMLGMRGRKLSFIVPCAQKLYTEEDGQMVSKERIKR